MDYKYKIRRLVKAGEMNKNGVIFDKDSTDKALKEYIDSGQGYIAKPLNISESGFVQDDLTVLNFKDIIGICSGFDDEYFYISELTDKSYEDKLDNYTCQICTQLIDRSHMKIYKDKKICITEQVLQLRLVENKEEENE